MLRSIAAPVLALSLLPAAVNAQTLVRASDPDGVAAVIRDLGYQARMDEDSAGDPLIRSSANGGEFRIEFYGCVSNKDCRSLRFVAGYDLRDGTTMSVINEWNAEKRYASAYLDDEDDPWLQMDIMMAGGISREAFEANFDIWQSYKADFETHVDFKR